MSHVQIFSVIAFFSLLGVVVPTYSFADESITINPSSLLPIRDDIYLLIFEVCAGSESISINQINVLSDIDSVILVQYAERDVSILSEECRQFEVQIKSTDPNKISIQSDALGFDIPIDYESIRDSPVSFQNVEVTMGMPTEISVRYVDLSHDSEGLTENDVL